jgi:hypothetical protein
MGLLGVDELHGHTLKVDWGWGVGVEVGVWMGLDGGVDGVGWGCWVWKHDS